VKLSTGDMVEADFVICAAGVRPNIEFLAGSGIRTGLGVLTDGRMQSSVPGIYAAGDVSAGADFNTGEPVTHAIQPVAVDEARVAALNMAGRECASEGGLAMNVLDTLGLVSTSFGQWSGTAAGEGVEEIDAEHFRYLSLQFEEDVLIGATSIGLTDHIGALRGLIQGRIRLGEWKGRLLRDPTRIMEAYLSGAQAQDQWHKVRVR
jgi:NAD(P)H-nitrite reductase large subunit